MWFVVVLFLLGVVFALLLQRQQIINDKWEGVVVRKNRRIVPSYGFQYQLWVKTGDGNTRQIAVTLNTYKSLEIGNKIVKEIGSISPIRG